MAVSKTSGLVSGSGNKKQNKVSFAKLLAGNDKKIRDKGLKKLKSWITLRSNGNFVFKEDDLMNIWVGLYYSLWMSDLPLVQEGLAEAISALIHCFNGNEDGALLFIKCCHVTISQAWQGIDQYRIDKLSMFVRRFLRQSLLWLAASDWKVKQVNRMMALFSEHVLGEKVALGFKLHFIDIFVEEFAKASKGKVPNDVLLLVLEPFARTAAVTGDGRVRMQCEAFFRQLIKQTDLAQEYNDKFDAWKSAGFPCGNLNLMVPVEDDSKKEREEKIENNIHEINGGAEDDSDAEDGTEKDDGENAEVEEEILDPRAGSVHVVLSQIQLPAKSLTKLMKRISALPEATTKGRRLMLTLCRRFKELQKGKYPFAVGKVCDIEKLNMRRLVRETAKREVNSELNRKLKKIEKKKLLKMKKKLEGNPEEGLEKKQLKKKKRNTDDVKKVKRDSLSLKRPKEPDSAKKGTPIKKRKSSFMVTAEAEENKSPVGTKRRKASDEPELELPPGWIVESVDDSAKKTTVVSSDWVVESDVVVVADPAKNIAQPIKASPVKIHTEEKRSRTGPSPTSPSKTSPSTPKKSQETEAKLLNSAGIAKDTIEKGEEEIIVGRPLPFVAHALSKLNKSKNKTPVSSPAALIKEKIEAVSESKSGRRISFNLAKNKAQEKLEWLEQIQRSPQIPFDASATPRVSALKQGLPPSPINPFYAVKLGLYNKT